MKILDKKDFIPFLKSLSDKLDKEEIEHEIPFCHIDKIEFNYISIIIPDHITNFDIGKLFNCSKINEKEAIIHTTIDDFSVDFIKTSTENWYYTLFYYSWNVIPVLMDILAFKSFNLRYTRTGLKYSYNTKIIDITKNMKDIFDFFELKFHMINNGFTSDYMIFEFIESSPFFNSEYFTIENFKKFDKKFDYNKQYYENFIQHKPDFEGEKKTIEEQVVYIDVCFPKAKFLEKLSRMQLKNEFPNLKDKDIIINPKSLEELKLEKEEEIKKSRKKISLKNIISKKDDDMRFDME